jgi:hypothetical protein
MTVAVRFSGVRFLAPRPLDRVAHWRAVAADRLAASVLVQLLLKLAAELA